MMRSASTQACGPSAVLFKNLDDIVAKRTPIGRAKKGQFKDALADEILRGLFKVQVTEQLLSISYTVHATLEKPTRIPRK